MTMYTECGHCGWIGPISELQDHPARPMPMDFGFCPECDREVDWNEFDEAEYKARLAEYE